MAASACLYPDYALCNVLAGPLHADLIGSPITCRGVQNPARDTEKRKHVTPSRQYGAKEGGKLVGPFMVSGGERGGKGGGIQIFHVQVSTIHGTHLRPCFAALPSGEEPVAPPHAAEAARRAKDDYEA